MSCTPEHVTEPAPQPDVGLAEGRLRLQEFVRVTASRRSVRAFSPEPVPAPLVEQAVLAASRAPSGANVQPWRFVHVTDPGVRRRVREAAEAEEREFYDRRATDEWLAALAPLGTDASKPFLTDVLGRPRNERPYVVLPVGRPAPDAEVPRITRKSLDEVLVRV